MRFLGCNSRRLMRVSFSHPTDLHRFTYNVVIQPKRWMHECFGF